MPVYEYECSACSHRFELRQKFSDEPASECPECRGPVKKLISQTGFALKGGGWFAQGYGNGSGSKPAPSCPSGGGCSGCPSAGG